MANVLKNKNGFTIIELLIAMIIFAFLLIAMLYGYIFAYRLSFENLLKNETVRIGQEIMEQIRNTPYDNVDTKCPECNPYSNDSSCVIRRQVRNVDVNFGILIGVIENIPKAKNVTVTVCTIYKDHRGQPIQYRTTSIITKRE